MDQVEQVRKIEIKLVEQEKKHRRREVDTGQPSVSREIKRKSSQEAEEEVDKQMMETGDHLERMRGSMRPVRGGCVEKWRDEAASEKVTGEGVNMPRKNALL